MEHLKQGRPCDWCLVSFQFSNNQILTGLDGTLFGKIVQKHETPVRALRKAEISANCLGQKPSDEGWECWWWFVVNQLPAPASSLLETEDGDGLTVLKTVYWAGGPVVPSAQSTVLPDTGPDTPDLLTIIPHSPLRQLERTVTSRKPASALLTLPRSVISE